MNFNHLASLLLFASVTCLAGCVEPTEAASSQAPPVSSETNKRPSATRTTHLPLMHVHKSASCGCCGVWIEHMQQAGFTVEVTNVDDVSPVKERVGVPYGKGSCHTAEVGGYFIEGHVPAGDVIRLLTEKPEAKGLVLPGMPLGSPGMEMPDGRKDPFTVELVTHDGNTQPYAHH